MGFREPTCDGRQTIHPQHVIIGKIGQYFFETDTQVHELNVTAAQYRSIIRELLPWFQQHASSSHAVHLLNETFPGLVLSRFCDQNWTLRLYDLTQQIFFCMGLFEVENLC